MLNRVFHKVLQVKKLIGRVQNIKTIKIDTDILTMLLTDRAERVEDPHAEEREGPHQAGLPGQAHALTAAVELQTGQCPLENSLS